MNDIRSKPEKIPDNWRSAVVAILRAVNKQRIISTDVATKDWNATFPETWIYERFEAIASALDNDEIMGCLINDMTPPCIAYEFFFSYNQRKLYGKVGLLPDGKVIIIFSNHIPRKGDVL